MRRRDAVLSLALVAFVSVVVRVIAANLIPFPRPEDTAYYVGVAQNLLEGRGLVSDALWSFGTPPLVFPRPAFEVWLPLPTILAAATMSVFGSTFGAAQVSSVIVGSLVPILAWWLAVEVGGALRLPAARLVMVALGAGLTAAVYLPLVLHSALPDSTMPFAVLGLLATILMARIVHRPSASDRLDLRLMPLGIILGLAALTRNEAVWLAATWVIVAGTAPGRSAADRVRMIGVGGLVALLVFAPWAYRNWVTFGSPLPGQAVTNALSLDGRDIFAWTEEPTLERYLAAGPEALLQLRVVGVTHNLLNVLLYLGIPVSAIALLGLPRVIRVQPLRPLLVSGILTFLATSLFFPVATTWGTFLHAAGPIHVLLIVSTVMGLDALIAWVGARRTWTRPVSWLGPLLGFTSSLLFTAALLPTFGAGSRAADQMYAILGARMAAAGVPMDASAGPVISNYPIWIAETAGVSALALPDEPPTAVLDLAAAFPGTRLVVVTGDGHAHWPHDIDAGVDDAECFREVDLGAPANPATPDPIADTRVFEIVCP